MTPVRLAAIALLASTFFAGLGCSKVPTPSQMSELNRELLQTVDHHDVSAARRLLDRGADIETKGYNGKTALGLAASNHDLAIVKLLLQKGAHVHAKDRSGVTPLMSAAHGGYADIAQLLLKETSDVAEKNEALLEAVTGGPAVVMIADPQKDHAASASEYQASISAAASPWVRTVQLLLDSGADLEATDQYRGTPLIDAAAHAQTDIVVLLLDRGANIKAKNNRGETALIAASCECALATMNSAYDVVRVLVEKGADVNARSDEGTTPLMSAAMGFGDSSILKLLLDHGAEPTARDTHSNTALKLAMEEHRPDKVLLLKKALANPHKR